MISNWEITFLPLYTVLGRVSITVPSSPLAHNPTSQHLVNQALSLKETQGWEQLELIHPTNVTMQRPCVHSCHLHPQSCFLRLGSACFCSTVSPSCSVAPLGSYGPLTAKRDQRTWTKQKTLVPSSCWCLFKDIFRYWSPSLMQTPTTRASSPLTDTSTRTTFWSHARTQGSLPERPGPTSVAPLSSLLPLPQ